MRRLNGRENMKKIYPALVMGAGIVLPGVALADPQLYGLFDIGLEAQKDEIGIDKKYTNTTWVLKDQNNTSRLGVKGEQDLGIGDLKAIYRLEYGIDPDGSEGTAFSERDIYLGLQDTFGEARFGRFDTPFRRAGAKADQFDNESIGDTSFLLVGETRSSNMLQYSSPQLFDHWTVTAALQPGEGRQSPDDTNQLDHGLADTWYATLAYDSKVLYASTAYVYHEIGGLKFDGVDATTTKTTAYDALRFAVYGIPMPGLELGALYQLAEGVDQVGGASNGGDAKETSWLASVGYSIRGVKFKAEYGETHGNLSDFKRTGLSLGIDYKVSKALTAQVYSIGYRQDAAEGVHDPRTTANGVGLVFAF